MLKKIFALSMTASLLFGTVYADISVAPEDITNDIMMVASNANAGEKITVLITNPGFDYEDVISGTEGSVQYYNTYVANNDGFAFPVQITGSAGGEFKVYIKSKGYEDSGNFVFYNSVFKKQCIDSINGADDDEDITSYFEKLINAYSFETDDVYNAVGSKVCAEAFLNIRNALPGKKLPDDIGEVMSLIEKSFVLAAFNSGSEELCFTDGKINYADVLSLSGSEELRDYYENIRKDATGEFNKIFLDNSYTSFEEITERFCELVYIYVLTEYRERGYGHIQGYFEKYNDEYEKAGFNIPSKENKSIYTQLTDLEADSLEELAKKFNKLEDDSEPKKSSSGGGGGGGNYSVNPSTGFVPPVVNDIQNEQTGSASEDISESKFKDVTDLHWAYEAIKYLSDTGIINGYSDSTFKPDNSITRAEFVKIIVDAFDIEKSTGRKFDDVSDDAWYAQYVQSASGAGILKGDGNCVNPDKEITREDAAVMLSRVLNKLPECKVMFEDLADISDYALDAVALLFEMGVINGYDDNTFRPQNSISRAEASKIIYKIMENGGGV